MNKDAIASLDQFGFLAVTGKDAQKFLQGYTTCDLEKLPLGSSNRGAICNIKGRMVSNFLACRTESGFLLRLNRQLVEPTLKFLSKYIVFSKAKLEDKSSELFCYGVLRKSLNDTGVDLPQDYMAKADNELGTIINVGEYGWELWSNDKIDTNEEGVDNTATWQQLEIENGIIWVDESTAEEYIPQMFNLHNIDAISFEKGCYLGQEIVARMQYRGELKKRLHTAQLPADLDLESFGESLVIGAKVLNEEQKNVGNIIARQGHTVAMVLKAGESGYTLENLTAVSASEILSA